MADTASLPKLLCFSGSLRAQSTSTAVANTLIEKLDGEVAAELCDISALPLYNADLDTDEPPASVAALKAAIGGCDGLLFVTPEYNYSVPGVLKNAIDWASRPGYQSVLKGKPAVIITVSAGFVGGARCQGHLKEILLATLTNVLPWPEVLIGGAPGRIEDGRLVDEETIKLSLAPIREIFAS